MLTVCYKCGSEITIDLTGKIIEKDEWGNWKQFNVECACGTVEGFNLNIPLDDLDEPFETGDLPLNEEIQRFYVRILQRLIRADLKNNSIKK